MMPKRCVPASPQTCRWPRARRSVVRFGLPPLAEDDATSSNSSCSTRSTSPSTTTVRRTRRTCIARPGDASETLCSQLLKSNCPVTGQPDWAHVRIAYAGPRIDRAGLLRYLVSFRDHAEFHEQCVERIFVDLLAHCSPESLSVEARYTRRGGLDINPWRATPGHAMPVAARDLRQ